MGHVPHGDPHQEPGRDKAIHILIKQEEKDLKHVLRITWIHMRNQEFGSRMENAPHGDPYQETGRDKAIHI
jgi:hypothetical protein